MLRGTNQRRSNAVFNQRTTLQNQITAIKAQVSKNKPETQYYLTDGTIDSVGLFNEISNIPVTANLIASTGFRDTVTGDRWANQSLKLTTYLAPDCTHYRQLIYVPKKVGNRFAPSLTAITFTAVPDKNAFWVLSDKLVSTSETGAGYKAIKTSVNFKGLHTLYNSSSAILERGEIVVCFITNGTNAATSQLSYGIELAYNNK